MRLGSYRELPARGASTRKTLNPFCVALNVKDLRLKTVSSEMPKEPMDSTAVPVAVVISGPEDGASGCFHAVAGSVL